MRIEEILYGNAGGAIPVSYCTPGTMHFSRVFRPTLYTTRRPNVTLRHKPPSLACFVAKYAGERVGTRIYYIWYGQRDGRVFVGDETVKMKTVARLQIGGRIT